MNCLYITLFFNIVAGIVQTFIKPWNQLLYPRVIEVCRQPFDQRWPTTPLFVVNVSPFFGEFMTPLRHILPIHNINHKQQQFVFEFPLDVHLLRWEIVWRNAPRIW